MNYNESAEMAVLGSVLVDNNVLDEIMLILEPDDFFYKPHRETYEAMLELRKVPDIQIDMVTLDTKTKGKYTTLIMDCNETPTAASFKYYAKVIKELSRERKIQTQIAKLEYANSDNLPEHIRKLQELNEVYEDGFHKLATLTEPVVRNMLDPDAETRGVKTHITKLDNALGCLRNSDLIVVGARPGMGKSAFVLSLMLNMAINGDASILFSLEMAKEQLTERLLCQMSDTSMQDMVLKVNLEANEKRITQVIPEFQRLPIYLNDKASKYNTIESIARQAHKKHGIKAIFIDYLQLIQTTKQMGDNRNQQLGYVTRNLKSLAKELNVPIVLLAQLNRGLEQRVNKRPMLSDLRDSGEIEQDVDIAIFLYRDEIYNRNTKDKGIVEIDIAKARNLEPKWFKLTFVTYCMKFKDMADDYYENMP